MKRTISDFGLLLAKCHAICNFCFDESLKEKNVQEMIQCLREEKDCAEICIIISSMLSSNNNLSKEALLLCIDACERCAKECEKYDYDYCLECAKVCHECANTCKRYIMNKQALSSA